MELKWLDDLVALAEEGSLSKAALRRNTTQPAFTRRIQSIEEWLGSKILDRSTKPARISAAITRYIEDVRTTSRNIKRLRADVQNWEQSHRQVSIATQHTLSITLFPSFVSSFHQSYPLSNIRLRSANRDECFSLLMTGQASVLVAYEAEGFWVSADNALIERAFVRSEKLVPIVARSHQRRLLPHDRDSAPLRVIGYPDDVFFGKILASQILPSLVLSHGLNTVCETALVPAVVGLAREGVGIAWVPESILQYANVDDQLVILDSLPSQELTVSAMRLKTPRAQTAENVWQALTKINFGKK